MAVSDLWQLNPDIDFLNHGSFGATPQSVSDDRLEWLRQLEADPIKFLGPERDLNQKLDHVRERVAQEVHVAPSCIAFVRNATDGVNAVLRSIPLEPGDEIVVTDHGYNACRNAAHFAAEQLGATVRVASVPFPLESEDQVVESIEAAFSPRTRVLLVDHVTSPTAIVFPIKRIIQVAKRHDIRVLVDGAHAPGMVDVDLTDLNPDYYAANHHKWWCAPKASGFLYVRPELQSEVRPTVISHGANRTLQGRSRFLTEFDWVGTYDPTPILSVPAALEFLECLHEDGITELMRRNRALALDAQRVLTETLDIKIPVPEAMIGSMTSIHLPDTVVIKHGGGEALKRRLFDKHRIEAPVFPATKGDGWLLRVSLQAYNSIEQIRRLAECLRAPV